MSKSKEQAPQYVAESIEFECPACSRPAKLSPNTKPMEVQHSLPECEGYELVKGDAEALVAYLQVAGLPVARTN